LNGTKTKRLLEESLKGSQFLNPIPFVPIQVPLLLQDLSRKTIENYGLRSTNFLKKKKKEKELNEIRKGKKFVVVVVVDDFNQKLCLESPFDDPLPEKSNALSLLKFLFFHLAWMRDFLAKNEVTRKVGFTSLFLLKWKNKIK